MRRMMVCWAALAAIVGCASEPLAIEVTHLEGWGAYQPEPFIQVLQAPPATAYVPIARLVVNGAAGLDRAQALAAIEQRARELGANALIVTDQTGPQMPSLTFNPSGGTYGMGTSSPGPRILGEAIHMSSAGSAS
jgi:hypothetical protein